MKYAYTPFLIFFVVAMALLSPSLSGVSFANEGAKSGKSEEKHEGGEKADKKKKNEDVVGGRFEGDPVYVHIQPLILPIITSKGAQQLVVMMIDLRVNDLATADKIQQNMPRIRDAVLQALYGGLGTGELRNGTLVDVLSVKAKLAPALEKVVGPNVIQEVLIQGISQRHL